MQSSSSNESRYYRYCPDIVWILSYIRAAMFCFQTVWSLAGGRWSEVRFKATLQSLNTGTNNVLTCVMDYNSGFTRYRFHESKLFPNWSKKWLHGPRSSALKLDLSLAQFVSLIWRIGNPWQHVKYVNIAVALSIPQAVKLQFCVRA